MIKIIMKFKEPRGDEVAADVGHEEVEVDADADEDDDSSINFISYNQFRHLSIPKLFFAVTKYQATIEIRFEF